MSSDILQVINPFDQSVVADLPRHTGQEIDAVMDRAGAAFETWSYISIDDRIRIIGDALSWFVDETEAIARDITLQMGKPINQARGEVNTMLDRARQSLEDAPVALAPDVHEDSNAFTRRIEHIPLGIVFNIPAWNYPLLVSVNAVVPALLAGNVVLIKHSSLTPLTGQAFEKAFGSLEIPNLVTNLIITHDQATRVIQDPATAHVCFTGSVPGGRAVQQAASSRFIDVGLELGGKDPAYIAEDADLDTAVGGVIDGACYNGGQCCCAVERIYVHRRRYHEFMDRAEKIVSAYVMGDPLEKSTTLGPMASPDAPGELAEQVEDARKRGADLVCGGEKPAEPEWAKGNFYAPTLLGGCPQDSLVMQEESFGPLVPVAMVNNDEEALEKMNDTAFGLTASVWTTDPERAERMSQSLNVGTVYANRCDYADPQLPWTGVRDSGKGSTLSRYGFYGLTRRKSIHFRRT